MTTYTKAKAGKLDYTINWGDWLDTDVIGTSTWTLPSGLTEVKSGIDSPATTVTIWISGGEVGSFYKITNTITTATSPERISSRSVYIEIYQR